MKTITTTRQIPGKDKPSSIFSNPNLPLTAKVQWMALIIFTYFNLFLGLCSQSQSYLTVSSPGYVFISSQVDFKNAIDMSGKKVEFINYTQTIENDGLFKVWTGSQYGYLYKNHVVYNNDYYSIMNSIGTINTQDIETVEAEEKDLRSSLSEISKALSKELPISSSINADVRASVKEKISDTGNKELNLHVEYFYEVVKAQIELETDDYPAGLYTLNSSNAATLTANFIKRTLETNLKKHIENNRKISIIITGSTDASPISSKRAYTGEFGNISDKVYFADGKIQSVNLNINETIKSNSQLAFLRTEGLRNYIEKNIPILKQATVNFEQRAIVSEEVGAKYRRISVEIIFHDAFQKKEDASKQDLTHLFLKCKNAVFLTSSQDNNGSWQGSGFFVNSSGVAVSNYHVINSSNFKKTRVTIEDGQVMEIEKVIEENKELDYAIFKVKNPKGLKFDKVDISYLNCVIGESVFAIGNPRGQEKTISEGIVSQIREEGKVIQTTTPITHGSSGGPLFNKRGEVIGITTGGIEGGGNLNFAVNIQQLKIERFK